MNIALKWFGDRGKEKADDDIASKYPKDGSYSKYVAKNPCISFCFALSFMLFVTILGPVITFTAKEFEVSNGGFEARGTDLSGLYMSYDHIMREECQGSLSLKPNAQSGYYKQEIEEAGDDDPTYPDYSTCSSDFKNTRRQLFYNHHHYENENELENKMNDNSNSITNTNSNNRQLSSTLLVTPSNAWSIASDAKDDVSLIFTGIDLFTANALKGMCEGKFIMNIHLRIYMYIHICIYVIVMIFFL